MATLTSSLHRTWTTRLPQHENDGAADPTWTAADITTSADGATSVYVADMDGDGDLDIVSASQNDDTIAWARERRCCQPNMDSLQILPPLQTALRRCMLPIWTVMAISTSFQHRIMTTPLPGTRTTVRSTLRGQRPTLPLLRTALGRCMLPTWTVMVTLISFQHPASDDSIAWATRTMVRPTQLGQHPILPTLQKVLTQCTSPTWTVMAISTLFQQILVMTQLRATSTSRPELAHGPTRRV